MDVLKKLLFTLLVIAFPLGEIARITINEIALTLVDIGVALVILTWFVLKKKFPKSKLSRSILIFIGVLILSLILNFGRLSLTEFSISFLYLLRWVFYTALYFVVLDLAKCKNLIKNWMVIGGLIIVIGGFIQYFLYPDLRNLYYLGWDEHLYRLFSSFLDPNFAGTFFVLYFLFILDNLLIKKENLVLKCIALATLIAIVLTFSRSTYIMLVIGIITFLILKGKHILGLIISTIFILSVFLTSIFVLKSEGTNLLRTASGEARIDSINKAITIIKDYPIFGVGFNSYRYAQRDYGFVDEQKMLIHSAAGTDNSFLFILATSGIVGFAAFIYLWFKIFSIKNSLVLASSVALFVNSFFINSLFYPFIMLWMWILIALKENN